MKGEGDNTRLDRDKPRGDMTMVKEQCASKVHWSTSPVEVGDGEPCGTKGTRDIGRLEITKGRRSGGVAPYVRKHLGCLEINNGDDRVECL